LTRPSTERRAAPGRGQQLGSPAGLTGPHGPAWLPKRIPGWLLAGVGYLVLGVAMWWHVWVGHPASTMACACGDPSSFAWFIAWPAYAISHGQSLLFSSRVHVPGGINLLDNTGVLALGVVLTPVTWLAGPIAALNVALTLAPVLSALSAYGCLRRALGLWRPAAFLAGLLFGYSPFMMRNEAISHLQVTFLALLPLIFLCCYELAVGQRGTCWRWGLALGLLATLQFFVGLEILAITAIMTALALLLALLAALARSARTGHDAGLAASLRFAFRGFLAAAIVGGALLAVPIWYVTAGPQHIRGADWTEVTANSMASVLFRVRQRDLPIIGYLGPAGTRGEYLGLLALLVVAIGVVVVRRPLVRLCAALLIIALWLSLGSTRMLGATGGDPTWLPLPWRALAGLPLLQDISPANFSVPAAWCVAVVAALLVDRVRPGADRAGQAGRAAAAPAVAGRMAAVAVICAALVIPWYLAWPLPFTTRTLSPPAWAVKQGSRLPASAVVLFYPFPASYQDQAVVWQAQAGLRYRIVGGRGIGTLSNGDADHDMTPGTPEGTMTALTTAQVPHAGRRGLPLPPSPGTVRSFRGALRKWGVTNVVMAPGGRAPAYARHWLTVVLGAPPRREGGVWVWNDVRRLLP
jgi:hypothetical protein